MNRLWMLANASRLSRTHKRGLFLGLLIAFSALFGAILWLVAGRLFLPSIDWLICFVGLSGVFVGFIGGVIYLYNHEFA